MFRSVTLHQVRKRNLESEHYLPLINITIQARTIKDQKRVSSTPKLKDCRTMVNLIKKLKLSDI